jgi:hypothetical protein
LSEWRLGVFTVEPYCVVQAARVVAPAPLCGEPGRTVYGLLPRVAAGAECSHRGFLAM